MTEGTIGSFLTRISNEVEKQMDADLKSFGINANELEVLIEIEYHKHGKSYEKLAKKIHVTEDKVKELVKDLVAKKLVVEDNGTGMISKDETLGLVNVLKKMLEKEEK